MGTNQAGPENPNINQQKGRPRHTTKNRLSTSSGRAKDVLPLGGSREAAQGESRYTLFPHAKVKPQGVSFKTTRADIFPRQKPASGLFQQESPP
jgi:hypothetical protein